MFQTPILFLIFNRPDTTAKVFERIREIRPARLYVAADAPRENRPGEAQRCAETRDIIAGVDWDCEVKTLFRDKNLGCRIAVSSAITWFFEHEEMGIILEDDCLPDPSFFPYCAELLERYKDDDRVGHIGGACFLPNVIDSHLSYDYSSIMHCWGWASWRRVWKNADVNFPFWNKYSERRKSLFCNKWEDIYFASFIPDAMKGKKDSWATFYYFSLRLQNQLCIYPAVNLVTNIGINDPNATHTKKQSSKHCVPCRTMEFPLRHPEYVLNNKALNTKSVKKHYFSWKRLARYLVKKLSVLTGSILFDFGRPKSNKIERK